ncbi:MAG TPA: thioredoxin domain-containing protein [Anaerolineales bacterium]|nr:thioredoxin domain-containing protein [Anaerolineales bacterium]
MRLKKFFQGDIVNWLVLFTLLIQISLLVALTQRITHLEDLIFSKPEPEIMDRIPDEQGHILGSEDAPVTVIEFADFQCPYCTGAESIVKQIVSQYPGKIKFIYRHFPLSAIHPHAMQSAMASECANEQGKFWEMHDLIFHRQQNLKGDNLSNEDFFVNIAREIGIDVFSFNDCLDRQAFNDYISQDISDGLKYGVNRTPTFFVNREKVVGVSSLESAIVKAIEEASE